MLEKLEQFNGAFAPVREPSTPTEQSEKIYESVTSHGFAAWCDPHKESYSINCIKRTERNIVAVSVDIAPSSLESDKALLFADLSVSVFEQDKNGRLIRIGTYWVNANPNGAVFEVEQHTSNDRLDTITNQLIRAEKPKTGSHALEVADKSASHTTSNNCPLVTVTLSKLVELASAGKTPVDIGRKEQHRDTNQADEPQPIHSATLQHTLQEAYSMLTEARETVSNEAIKNQTPKQLLAEKSGVRKLLNDIADFTEICITDKSKLFFQNR